MFARLLGLSKTMNRQEKYEYLGKVLLPALRKWMLDAGVSYRKAARQLGGTITHARIQQWVEGDGFPHPKNIATLEEFLKERGFLS